MQRHLRTVFVLTSLAAAICAPAVASAQPRSAAPLVETPDVEVALGITVNSLGIDLNAEPNCHRAGRPCVNARPSSFGGFGLDGSLAVRQSSTVSIVSAVHLHSHAWKSGTPRPDSRAEYNSTISLLVGPSLRSGWFVVPGWSDQPSRVFTQVLVGAGNTTASGLQTVMQVGGGIDSIVTPGPYSRLRHEVTMRMSFDYRFGPGRYSDIGGWQFGLGLVIGPRLR